MQFKDNTLPGILRSLVADEFLAWTSYYFYEIISQGKALNFTNKIFEKNGKDELEDHYKKLTTWMQSNSIPVPTDLEHMMSICNTPYKAYLDPSDSGDLVQQMITAEQEAIDAYVQAMKEPAVTAYPDLVVMLGEICNDEREHLKELVDVMSNIAKGGSVVMTNFSESSDDVKWLSDQIDAIIKSESEIMNSAQETIDDLTEINQQKWEVVGRIPDTSNIENIMKYIQANKFLVLIPDISKYMLTRKMSFYYNQINLIVKFEERGKYRFIFFNLSGEAADPKLISLITSAKGGELADQKNFSARINSIKKLFSTDPNKDCYVVIYKDEDGESKFNGTYDECHKFIESCQARVSSGEKFELISGPDKCE